MKSTELTKTDAINEFVEFANDYITTNRYDAIAGSVKDAFLQSEFISQFKNYLTEDVVKYYLMPLMGQRIGFLTDKDKDKSYTWEVVRNCYIDAVMLAGLKPCGNEFNIIASKMYITKEGYSNTLKRMGWQVNVNVNILEKNWNSLQPGSIVKAEVSAEWKKVAQNGNWKDTISLAKKYVTDSVDILVGKFTARGYAKVYQLLTGIDMGVADSSDLLERQIIDRTNEKLQLERLKIAEQKFAKINVTISQIEDEGIEWSVDNLPQLLEYYKFLTTSKINQLEGN